MRNKFFNTSNMVDFSQIFVISLTNEALIELNFWLEVYV